MGWTYTHYSIQDIKPTKIYHIAQGTLINTLYDLYGKRILKIMKISICTTELLCCIPETAAAKSFQSRPTLCDPVDCRPPGSSICGDSPGKKTGRACHALLQRIFPNQRSNPCLLHQQEDSLPLSQQECPPVNIYVFN